MIAAEVKVTDILPPGVEIVSVTASAGGVTLSNGIVTGNLGTLAAGGRATLTIVAQPAALPGGTISNTATVSSNQVDPVPADNNVLIETNVLADTDGDGMPDTFESSKGLNPADPADAPEDRDHDGSGNLAEFRAGTDPVDRDSLLRVSVVAVGSGSAHFTFPTVAGKNYRVEYADDPGVDDWEILADQVAGTGSDRTIDDASAGTSPRRFYRVSVITP